MKRTLLAFMFLLGYASAFGQGVSPGTGASGEGLLALNGNKPEQVSYSELIAPAVGPAPVEQTAVSMPAPSEAEPLAEASATTTVAAEMLPVANKGIEDGVTFYPNPVKDYINIRFPARGNYTVRIFNIVGKQVAFKTIVDEDLIRINISEEPNGMFFLKYEVNGKEITKTFSKI